MSQRKHEWCEREQYRAEGEMPEEATALSTAGEVVFVESPERMNASEQDAASTEHHGEGDK